MVLRKNGTDWMQAHKRVASQGDAAGCRLKLNSGRSGAIERYEENVDKLNEELKRPMNLKFQNSCLE